MVSRVINRTKFVEGANPLLSYARKEETVVVEDGITSIYHKAFSGCYTIKKLFSRIVCYPLAIMLLGIVWDLKKL